MFEATTSPSYLPTWVSGQAPLTSPIAQRRVGHPEVVVDLDPVRVGLDADRLQADVLDPRAAAGGDEDAVAAQLAAVVEVEHVVVAVAARGGHFGAEHQLDPFAAQFLAERFAERRRFAGEQVRGAVDHGRRCRRAGSSPGPARPRPGRRRAPAGAAAPPSCWSPRASPRRRRAPAAPAPAARTARRRWRAPCGGRCGGCRRPRPRPARRAGRRRAAARCRVRPATFPGWCRSIWRPCSRARRATASTSTSALAAACRAPATASPGRSRDFDGMQAQ